MKRHWVISCAAFVLVILAIARGNVAAQADRNCKDFANQTEAQLALNGTYPEDPNGLDRDKDWIACEDFFGLTEEEAARVVPANLAQSNAQSTPEPTPASSNATAPPPSDTAPGSSSSRIDPPADLMAQVAQCEVVAVSSRSIAAAGCPGVGSIVLRPPAGTPRMRSQVIIRPGAAFAPLHETAAAAAQVARSGENTGKPEERKRSYKKHDRAGRSATRTK